MPVDPAPLTPQELVVLLVAVGGIVPLLLYRDRLPRWLLVPYGFLLVGAVATNIENLLWHDPINFVEHSVGNLGAGVAVAAVAYLGNRRLAADAEAGE